MFERVDRSCCSVEWNTYASLACLHFGSLPSSSPIELLDSYLRAHMNTVYDLYEGRERSYTILNLDYILH